jgi:hypothetical protein
LYKCEESSEEIVHESFRKKGAVKSIDHCIYEKPPKGVGWKKQLPLREGFGEERIVIQKIRRKENHTC